MTQRKLLENLNTTAQDYNNGRTFKAIAKHQHGEAVYLVVLVSETNAPTETNPNPQPAPAYILVYRLDINYLTDVKAILYNTRVNSRDLKAFEKAITK